MAHPREYTIRILDLMDEGAIDPKMLVQDLLGWISERDVKDYYMSELAPILDLFEEDAIS